MGYCNSGDLRRYLPRAVVFEGDNPAPNPRNPNPESLQAIDADFYIEQASEMIDSILGAIFDVPLKKVNIGGRIQYPSVIRVSCAMLAAHQIFQERLSGAEKMEGDFTKRYYEMAMQRLDNVLNGHIRLTNQNSYNAHRTIKSDLFARPPSPAMEPSTAGKP